MSTYYPDISHYHPVSDWSKVKASCPFLISKATQGTSYVDTTLTSFIQGCEANKIPYWLYAYLNKGDELAQAKFLVKTCKDRVCDYFQGYILDVEAGNTAAGVKSALEYLEGLGVKCMIYTMYSQYNTYKSVITGRSHNTAWWEARYGKNNGAYSSSCPAHDGADLHQYTSVGSCPGISGNCDLNRLTGTKAEGWFTGAAAVSSAATSTAKDYIKLHQAYVNSVTDAGIAVDGMFGPKTLTASIMALQTLLNRLKNAGLAVDGIFGPLTKAAVETLKRGSYGVLVHLLQGMLYCRGCDPKGLDYSFGACTEAAVRAFQQDAGIAVDGVVGPVTWETVMAK